jgi:uncharacterized protein (TIGR02246 family)
MGPDVDHRPLASRDDEAGASPADEAAVRALFQQLLDGWNRGSGDDFAAPFAEDADFVAFDGTHFKGRREIAAVHQQLFDKWLKATRLVGHLKDVQFLSPDVAVMHAVGRTVMRGKARPSPERDSIQTLVAARRDGEWRLTAFHNTRLHPIGRNLATALVWTFSDWLWKIFRLNKGAIRESLGRH